MLPLSRCSYVISLPLCVFHLLCLSLLLSAYHLQPFLFTADLLSISPDRLSITAVDFAAGTVALQIKALPLDANMMPSSRSDNYNTLWEARFVVDRMSSISVRNATMLLESCGIHAVSVNVLNGTTVVFRASNASMWRRDCLGNNSLLNVSSISDPGEHVFNLPSC